jgi:hypothetical protein
LVNKCNFPVFFEQFCQFSLINMIYLRKETQIL